MGAINYKTSNYITIGYNCDFIDYEDEFWQEEVNYFYEQVKSRLEQERFYYWHIKIEPGYYEGFYIDIKLNYCYFDYIEKQEAQKEVTQIKKLLLTCINDFECCSVFPGWCTSYKDYNESLTLLNRAIQEMREAVKKTPSYNNYKFIA